MNQRQDWFARTFPRTNLLLGWIWFVVITILTITFAILAIRELVVPSTSGHLGTAVVVECDTNHGTYRECFGNFSSNDGQVSFVNTRIWGEDGAHAGDRFMAYGDPNNKTVTVPTSGQSRFTDVYLTLVFLVVWIVTFIFRIYLPLRRRKRRRQGAASQG
jgi:hypothetical protein